MKDVDIHSLFFPSQHITDPKWFAGRKGDIENALQSLCMPGASMIVFGERGSGKTSFVEMIKQLASGDHQLIFKHNFQKLFPPKKIKYKIISFTCNDGAKTTSKVLQNLITNPDGIKKLIPYKEDIIESSLKSKLEIGGLLSFFTAGINGETKTTESAYKEEDVFEVFTNLVLTVSTEILAEDEGLLIVVDEFDLVEDSEKMASLIKTLSKDKVKFMLCGIADSYDSLIKGHKSIIRQIMYGRIQIGLMTEQEIDEVFKLVTYNTNNKVHFEDSFKKEVSLKSQGFPYFVQLFGKLALDNAMLLSGGKAPLKINNSHLKNGLKRLTSIEMEMEHDYLSIIGENPEKELAIKFLSRHVGKKIKDGELFNYLHKNKISSPNAKNTLKSLLSHREPHFLLREKSNSEYVLFVDTLFRTFINCREAEFLKIIDGKYTLPS